MRVAPMGWLALRKELADLSHDDLVTLIKDLCDASPANKSFLQARLMGAAYSLDSYKKRIRVAFYSPSKSVPWDGYPKLSVARAVLSEFKKARPGDVASYADLQLFYAETGIELANDFGGASESTYNSVLSVTRDLCETLTDESNAALFQSLTPRLGALLHNSYDCGYGVFDDLDVLLNRLAAAHGTPTVFAESVPKPGERFVRVRIIS